MHAKTLVADGLVSVVGTANMDIRSFDLNFEIMSVIFSPSFSFELEESFIKDLEIADEVNLTEWNKQGKMRILFYAIARLISSFL